MRAILSGFFSAAILGFTVRTGFCLEDGLSPAVLNKVKAATVFLKIQTAGGDWQGSGFFITKDILATNAHVLGVLGRRYEAPRGVTAVVNSGMPDKELQLKCAFLCADMEADLAFVRVERAQGKMPEPLELLSGEKVRETMPVYIFGFPFGDMLATGVNDPAVTIGMGSVSSMRMDERGALNAIQINGNLNPGNSGGPIVDKNGGVLAVSVATIAGTQIGFSIPADTLRRCLEGHAAGFETAEIERNGEKQSMKILVSTVDPLKKISALSVNVWTAVAGSARPKDPARKVATYGAPGDGPRTEVRMKYDDSLHKWVGQIKDMRVSEGAEIWGQTSYSNKPGAPIVAAASNLTNAMPPGTKKTPLPPPMKAAGPHWHLTIPIAGEYKCPAGHVYTPFVQAASIADANATVHSMEFTFKDELSWGRNYDCQGVLHSAANLDMNHNFSARCGGGQVGRETPGYPDVMNFYARYDFDTGKFETSTPGQESFTIQERKSFTFDSTKMLYARGWWGRGDGHPGPKASNIIIRADISCAHMPGAVMLSKTEFPIEWRVSPAREATAQKLYRAPAEKGPFSVLQRFTENTTCKFTDATATPGTIYYYKVIAESAAGLAGAESNVIAITAPALDKK